MTQAKIKQFFLVLIDVILINIAYVLAYLLRFDWHLPMEYFTIYMEHAFFIIAIKVAVFNYFSLYNSIWKYASVDELVKVTTSVVAANILVVGYFLLFQVDIPRSLYALPLFVDILFIGGIRFNYRIARKVKRVFQRDGKKTKRVLIVGAGEAGAMVIKELKKHQDLNKKPIAIVDCEPSKQGRRIHGVPVVGTKHHIERIVKEKDIEEIIIAIPSADRKQVKCIISECKKTKCKLKILPGIFEVISGKVTIKQIRDVEIEDLLGREPVEVDLDAISGYLKNKVVLVTGGGGSIGSELCRQIAKHQPTKLLILDIYENNAYDLQQELKTNYPQLNMRILIASVRDKPRLQKIFSQLKPQVVFHAAAHKHVPLMEDNPAEAIKNNVFGTLNVAECADKYGTEKFVLISTDKAVNPTNIMGATKRLAEMLIQSMNNFSKTDFVAVRFGNVLGSNGSVIPLFKKQIAQGGPVTVTHPEIIRYFMTIPEAVQLVIQAGSMAKGGEIFVLDMEEPVKILDLARDLIKLSGFEPNVDIKIEFTGLRPGEKLYEELLMAEEGLIDTQHEKIFVAKPLELDLKLLRVELEKLRNILVDDNDQVKDFMEQLVPTYKRA